MRGKASFLTIALLLSGCMLPQPDTPIIPPPGAAADFGRAQPQEGVGSQKPIPTSAPTATQAEDALFSGTVVGDDVKAIVAAPEGTAGRTVRQELGADGAFALTLMPGTYRIELVAGDDVAILEPRITVEAGQDQEVILRVMRDPLAVTMEPAPPEEPATPEATATES